MPQAAKYQLAIILAATVVLFTNLGRARLWDEDEPRNAACAREMMERGDWITPTFNGQLRTDKPILLYWLMRGSYAVFGPTEFAARFWSATLAIGTALCTYHLGRILFRREVGLWAGLAIATALMFGVAGRAATPDSTLIFFTTLSLLLFVRGAFGGGSADDPEIPQPATLPTLVPQRWIYFALAYATMGMAVLAKGPVGLLLPCGVIGLYLMWLNGAPAATDPRPRGWLGRYDTAFAFARRMLSPRSFAQCLWAMRPVTLLIVVAAVALPWYIAVGVQTDGEWLTGFLWKHNVERFSGPMEGHRGNLLYYPAWVLAGFFPWSVFLPLTLFEAGRRIATHHRWRRSYVFLTCWIGLYLTLFSLAGTKLPSYVLPMYPALAVLTGAFLNHVLRQPASIGRWWMPLAFGTVALVGLAGTITLWFVLGQNLPDEQLLAFVAVVPLVGGLAAIVLWERTLLRPAMFAMAVTAVASATVLFGIGAVRVSHHQNSAPLAESIRQAGGAEARVATFAYLPSSLVYYAGHVEVCQHSEEVLRFFELNSSSYLVTLAESLDRIQSVLPPDVVVLERQPRFSKRGEEVLLLGRRTLSTDRRASQLHPPPLRR